MTLRITLFLLLFGPAALHGADQLDLLYEYRIAALNKISPIELDYNPEVRRYIDLYTGSRKGDMARIAGLASLYFPIFDEYLDRYGLPLELKYLTIVESGLNPLAVSKSGAVGLWQFMLNTARLFDLEVTSYVDERRDVYKSTDAACRYLRYMYQTYGDWKLVLGSYNGGPGEIRKAIERSGGITDYWQLRPYLSEQARNYVPAFIAAFYVMHYQKEHGIAAVPPPYSHASLDSLRLSYAVSFSQISAIIGLPVEKIRQLNPAYKRDYIPESTPPAVLVLPADLAAAYLRKETQVLGHAEKPADYNLIVSQAGNTGGLTRLEHEVQPGEFTHAIAMRYNCTLENIRAWNNLPSFEVKAGQKLVIWVKE